MTEETGHGHSGPFKKIAEITLFNACMKFDIFLGQMLSFEVLCKHRYSLLYVCIFFQNWSQAPSKWIKVVKWDYFKNPS